jgi:hypothetical protein
MFKTMLVLAGGVALIAGMVTVTGYTSYLSLKNSEGTVIIWNLLPPQQ